MRRVGAAEHVSLCQPAEGARVALHPGAVSHPPQSGLRRGDLAVCVIDGVWKCDGNCTHHGRRVPPRGSMSRVVAITPVVIELGKNAGARCGCVSLHFENGFLGASQDSKGRHYQAEAHGLAFLHSPSM